MQRKGKRTTNAEREHMRRVKELPCSLCDAPPPSEAHHLSQSSGYSCAALCPECHRGPLGWHGTRSLWRIKKMTEQDALYKTIERLAAEMSRGEGVQDQGEAYDLALKVLDAAISGEQP